MSALFWGLGFSDVGDSGTLVRVTSESSTVPVPPLPSDFFLLFLSFLSEDFLSFFSESLSLGEEVLNRNPPGLYMQK
jgi:hypothetical protein